MRRNALIAASLFVSAAALGAGPKKGTQFVPAPGDPSKPGSGAGPKAKAPGVCGAKIFALNEGNTWTYEAMAAQTPPDPKLARITPLQPKSIVITVKSIDAKKGADTVVNLEEKVTTEVVKADPEHGKPAVIDERTLQTTITCDGKKKFEVSPDSFWFAGEPGGTIGVQIDKVDRSHDTSWKLVNGGIGDQAWREEIVMQWTRVATPGSDAKLGSGKLELERSFTPEQPEMIITKLGTYRAEKVGLVTTGRVTLATPASPTPLKPMELPAGWLSTIWLADGVGPIQVMNGFYQMYQLASVTVK
ncbi:MAG: hypothetical protein ACM31C_11745 [Acidobacteriota bacterium]